MSWSSRNLTPDTKQKVIVALSYLTSGIVGILYVILSKNRDESYFFRFGFFQSVVVAIIGWLLGSVFSTPLMSVFSTGSQMITSGAIPDIMTLIAFVVGFVFGVALPGYGAIMALLGKSAHIPVLSPLVQRNLR